MLQDDTAPYRNCKLTSGGTSSNYLIEHAPHAWQRLHAKTSIDTTSVELGPTISPLHGMLSKAPLRANITGALTAALHKRKLYEVPVCRHADQGKDT